MEADERHANRPVTAEGAESRDGGDTKGGKPG